MSRAVAGAVVCFFVLQLVLVAMSPWGTSRYLGWAPFHEHAEYRVEARLGGRTLEPDEIRERYHLYRHHYDPDRDLDWETNRITHVFDAIRRVEERSSGRAEVRVHYVVNGGRAGVWSWP